LERNVLISLWDLRITRRSLTSFFFGEKMITPQDKYLILSALTQMLFPFVAMIIMFRRRVASLKSGEVKMKYFSTYNKENNLSDKTVAAGRHFTNLFEMPTLFYAIVAFIFMTRQTDLVFIILAWLFVLVRLFHSVIHLGNNNIRKRMRTFGLSSLFCLIMVVYLIGKICLL